MHLDFIANQKTHIELVFPFSRYKAHIAGGVEVEEVQKLSLIIIGFKSKSLDKIDI